MCCGGAPNASGQQIVRTETAGDVTIEGGVLEGLSLSYVKILLRDEINLTQTWMSG